MVVEHDRDDLMAGHVPTFPLVTSDTEPARAHLWLPLHFHLLSQGVGGGSPWK